VLGGIGLGRYVAGMELMTDELKVNTEAITTNTAANTDSIRALGKLVDRFQFQQEHTQRQLDQMADFRESDEARLRRVEDALLVISTKDGMGKGG
jgi:nicotinamide riboside kinase